MVTTAFAIGRDHQCVRIVLILTALVIAAVETPRAQHISPSFPRVRTSDPRIVAAIAIGIDRSPTLRRLISTIDGTNGLIYIREGRCSHGGNACLLLTVTQSGPNRVLHIRVDVRGRSACRMAGSIGHELQHAIEALSDPAVTSDLAIFNFFRRLGPTAAGPFETSAALDAGMNVEKEACRQAKRG